MSTQAVIDQAVQFLTAQPFDAGHDLEHHRTVLTLAEDIAQHSQVPIDLEALKIAVMWHDVVTEPVDNPDTADRNQIKLHTCEYVRSLLTQQGFAPTFVTTVVEAVQYHSFEDQPRNTEGKILFDADKLAAIDLPRWRKVVQAHETGKMSDTSYIGYLTAGKQWLREMTGKLHFAYSQQLFTERMKAVMQDPWAQKLALQIDVNLETYL